MRILVAGAAGFVGLAAVRALTAAGHEVDGLVRSAKKENFVAAAGGVPVLGDVLDPATLTEAVEGCEAIVHLAAGDPEGRARVDGARNLLAAARKAGVRRFVCGSGYWVYGDRRETITEDTPLNPIGPSTINRAAEEVVLDAAKRGDCDAIVVRPPMIYGDGAWFRDMVDRIRAGTYRYVCDGANRWSPLHLADAGEAFRVIVERGMPGVYNVADDRPVAVRTFASFVATALGTPAPSGIPFPEAANTMGEPIAHLMSANQAMANAKVKGLGWRPRFSTYEDGLPDVLRGMGLLPR